MGQRRCAPIDLASASRAIDSGLINTIYQRSFLRFLTNARPAESPASSGSREDRSRRVDVRLLSATTGVTDALDHGWAAARGRAPQGLTVARVVLDFASPLDAVVDVPSLVLELDVLLMDLILLLFSEGIRRAPIPTLDLSGIAGGLHAFRSASATIRRTV